MKGGARAHPLHPRDHSQLLNRKVRALGLATALSSKLKSGLLRVVQDLDEAGWEGTNQAQRGLCDGFALGNAVQAEPTEVPTEEVGGVKPVERYIEGDAADPALLDSATAEAATTREPVQRFGPVGGLSILFVHSPFTPSEHLESFHRTTRNLPGIEVLSLEDMQVWHILKYKWLVIEGSAIDVLAGYEVGTELDFANATSATQEEI